MELNLVINKLVDIINSFNNTKNNSVRNFTMYETLKIYLDDIKSIKSLDNLIKFRNEIYSKYKSEKANYVQLNNKYIELKSKNAPINERNIAIDKVNESVYKTDALLLIVEEIQKFILGRNSNKKFISTSNKPSSNNVSTIGSTSKTINRSSSTSEFMDNPITYDYLNLNESIKNDYMRLIKLDYDNKESNEVRKKLYSDINERRKYINSHFSDPEIYSGLLYIESQERLLFTNRKSVTMDKKELNVSECINILKKYLNELSTLNFSDSNDVTSKLTISTKYHDLIMSIANLIDDDKVEDKMQIIDISTDLLSLVSVYNIDRNYEKFKNHYKNTKIGVNNISKKMYLDALDEVNNKMNKLFNLIQKNLKNKIIHYEKYSKTVGARAEEINNFHIKICNMLISNNKFIRR